jgi:CopG family nickel-responsive transcriptional regulator
MTDKHCLEVVVVKGDVKYIRTLSEKIMRLKGVEHVRLTSTAVGKSMELEKSGASSTISP